MSLAMNMRFVSAAENGHMNYAVYYPDNYEDLPLLVYLHGAGERGTAFDHVYRHGIPLLLDQGRTYPAIILVPQCPVEVVWCNIVDRVKAIIDTVAAEFSVRPDRICLTGSSMGGYGTWSMALTYPNFVSAIAPIAGGGMAFSYKAFNSKVSFASGWAAYGAFVAIIPWEAIQITDVLCYLFPALKAGKPLYSVMGSDIYLTAIVIGVLCSILLFSVNMRGLSSAASLQKVLCFVLVGAALLGAVASLIGGDLANLKPLYDVSNPDIYGAAGSTSGGVDIRPFPKNWGISKRLGTIEEHPENWEEHTVVNLVDRIKPGQLSLIIDCGYDDFFFGVNCDLHERLLKAGIKHDFYVREGVHNWDYWRNSIQYQLLYFSNYFKSQNK